MRTGYDLIIIGSGSAAFAAGIEARALGASVALVERGTLGGTCVNVGCVPSKALLAAADAAAAARSSRFEGVETELRGVDLATVVMRKNELVAQLRTTKYQDVAAAHDFDLLRGVARFVDQDTLAIDDERVAIRAVVIAAGARPHVTAIAGLPGVEFLTSTSAMQLHTLPARLVVIGAGFVGAEQAQLFSQLGSKVTLIGPLMAGADEELRDLLDGSLQSGGITRCKTKAVGVERTADGILVHCAGGWTAVGDQILVATGRIANTEDLALRTAGIDTDGRGHVVVDESMRTTNPRVFAAGDITTAPQFVYVAATGGRIAARNALSASDAKIDYRGLPHVAFTSPQLAWCGMTEREAQAAGHEIETRTLSLAQVPRALVNQDTQGAVKIVAEAGTRRVLGVHVLADHGGELLYGATIAIKAGLTVDQLADTWAPYLTMSEALKLAAQSFKADIGTLSCCA